MKEKRTHTSTTAVRRYLRRRRERKERDERLRRLSDKREMLQSLMKQWELIGEYREAVRIRAKLRTVEQQIRYISV